MYDVVFVMANSRLNKKDVQKTKMTITLIILLLMMKVNEEANSTLDASDEDILVEFGEDVSGVIASNDDLEIPPVVENDEGRGGDDINENEDSVKDDDYPAFNMKNLLG